MPVYQYECKACGKVQQELFSINKRPDALLCDCGEVAERIISKSHFEVNGANAANNYSGDSNYFWGKPRGKR